MANRFNNIFHLITQHLSLNNPELKSMTILSSLYMPGVLNPGASLVGGM